MEEKKEKKRRGRRAYLNDFQVNVAGEYIYTGKVYRWGSDRKGALLRMWTFGLGAMAAAVAAGCIPGTGMEGAAWALLPYVVSLIAACTCVYAVGRLSFAGTEVREYVFQASVDQLPIRCMVTAIAASVAILGEIVNLFLPSFAGNLAGGILLMVLEGAILGFSVLLRGVVVRLKWTNA